MLANNTVSIITALLSDLNFQHPSYMYIQAQCFVAHTSYYMYIISSKLYSMLHTHTSACGRHPDTTTLGRNLSIGRAVSSLELSSSSDASEAISTGDQSEKLVCMTSVRDNKVSCWKVVQTHCYKQQHFCTT